MHLEKPNSITPKTLRNGNPRGNPANAPRCGAKTRAGSCCQSPAIRGKQRCRMHGGNSSGAPCDKLHGMYKHGRYTKMAMIDKIFYRELLQTAKAGMKMLEGSP